MEKNQVKGGTYQMSKEEEYGIALVKVLKKRVGSKNFVEGLDADDEWRIFTAMCHKKILTSTVDEIEDIKREVLIKLEER